MRAGACANLDVPARARARARKKREKIRKFHTKNTFSFFIKSGGEHIYFDMGEGIEKVKGDVKSAFEKIKGIKNIKINRFDIHNRNRTHHIL